MTMPRVYPIVDSAEWVRRLVHRGVSMVQLRIKSPNVRFVQAEVAASLALCEAQAATLVLNDHWQMAIELGAGFVHLGQGDLDQADVGKLRSSGVRLGISTHDEAELERALRLAPDYVALGPIWPTTLKAMPWMPQGVARITEWKAKLGRIPLVAIGGITLERAPSCWAAGADSVSFVSDIGNHADPATRILDWVTLGAAVA